MNLFNKTLEAKENLRKVISPTPLLLNVNLSSEYKANVFLKREDLQVVRSYKIRGAFNKIQSLHAKDSQRGIVCASAGNHAQGVAYSCQLLGIKGKIFMPKTTPKQKIKQVQLFGKSFVEIVLEGDTFDDAYNAALVDCQASGMLFIHPFDDEHVIAGQGTTALEILDSFKDPIDYVFVPIGGGGLVAGIISVFKVLSPITKIIGVEPLGAPSMKAAIENKKPIQLQKIDRFVDGAAVKQVGKLNFEICKDYLHEILIVPEGKVCTTILKLYNEEALVVEPAGALTIAALDLYREKIIDKNIICIVSGSNNDIERTEEIKERSLLYEGLKHYFIVQFPQRPGALKEFVNDVLTEHDDITYFQFIKKNNREVGPVVVGVEVKEAITINKIKEKMTAKGFEYQYLNKKELLMSLLV
ncbi:threonine ammonia-lyase IlvA [Flavobacterium sp. 20NA77.7]|uniref:L-threonine dehydratase n=1 Tax=Flavobacterium nakdongensis TaxID=3073563 RepID=A0ABY9R9P3_9FLAO|nr:threonine ammonia-lyase IlvA [Flavobacterium sp. 20NA77.7]WMW76931.1 threonine ammonia-lyase IlvA [Flavobacterium sp. 20NA77.7]